MTNFVSDQFLGKFQPEMPGVSGRLPRGRHTLRAARVWAFIPRNVHWDMAAAAVDMPGVSDLSARASREEVVYAADV